MSDAQCGALVFVNCHVLFHKHCRVVQHATGIGHASTNGMQRVSYWIGKQIVGNEPLRTAPQIILDLG